MGFEKLNGEYQAAKRPPDSAIMGENHWMIEQEQDRPPSFARHSLL
jgi:hypothetical protein